MNLENISILVEIINRAVVALGILVGGAWTYLTYLRGRLFAERLELSIDAEADAASDVLRVVVYCGISNVGTRKVAVSRYASAVTLKALALTAPETDEEALVEAPAGAEGTEGGDGPEGPLVWQEIVAQPVFRDVGNVEPAESKNDATLLQVPRTADPFGVVRLELEVHSETTGRRWSVAKVVKNPSREDN